MSINTKRTESRKVEKHLETRAKEGHLNWMGGVSYDVKNPIHRLRLAASSCFFGEPMYYADGNAKSASKKHSPTYLSDRDLTHLRKTLNAIDPQEWRGLSPSNMLEKAIDDALDYDAEATLIEAVSLRNEDNIRTTPQVILVRAANHANVKGTGLLSKYADRILRRGDEPAVCLAYQLSKFGKPVPNSLKKVLAAKLESMDEYSMSKYRMESRKVKTVDVVNVAHPKHTDAIGKLINGTLKLADNDSTWEAMRSSGKSWEECIPVMGHMALLRNLRNFHQNGVHLGMYLDKLVEGVSKGKQLPFRYYTAYRELSQAGGNPQVLDALELCLENSYLTIPKFSGKMMCLSDNSGSAHGAFTSDFGSVTVSDIANLTAVIAAKNSDEGYVGVFGDGLKVIPVRKRQSTFDLHKEANSAGQRIGHGTENGIWLFWDKAIRNTEHYDNVFVFSDMQAGHGGLYGLNPTEYGKYRWSGSRNIDVPMLINEYRRTVNKNINVFLVQVAGYQDIIVPEFYERTYILGGWSGNVLAFAARMGQMMQ